MVKMVIVLDTSVLCAYANKSDVHHGKAVELMRKIISQNEERVIITDHIFDELISVTKRKSDKSTAVETGRALLRSEIHLVYTDELIFGEAWNLFEQKNTFSFTDCTIIAFMRIFGITKIASFDSEFKTIAGLDVLRD